MLTKFPPNIHKELGSYVYLYIDPRDMRPFYIGMGQGDRVFDHLTSQDESKKAKILKEIRDAGREPILEILKYKLNRDEAFLVEATAIDLLDVQHLANKVRGRHSRHGNRGRVEDICNKLSVKPIRIEHPLILINIARNFRYGMTPQALYDATRSAWKIRLERATAKYALAVYQRVVREVYEIARWLDGGTTMRHDDTDGRHKLIKNRFEFVGKVADSAVRDKYLGRTIGDDIWKPGAQNPIKYVGS
jgi:hypothetical protein